MNKPFSPQELKSLFDGINVSSILDFEIDEFKSPAGIVDVVNRISVSGVQEKFAAIVHGGKINLAAENEQSTHILKPAPWDYTLRDRKLIPANEHLTMQIAARVFGISTAANALCFTPNGQPVYITRRFDILPDGTKIKMEDFASIIGKNEQTSGRHFKYNGSYLDIASAIRQNVAAWMVDMERFFELIVFNYIYANGDAHLKNFSLILQGQDYRLAPAYDLMNTALHIDGDDFALDLGLGLSIEKSDVMERTGHPCRADFERFGREIGLIKRRIDLILNKYMVIPEEARALISASLLPEKAKRNYLRILNERTNRFNRQSE